MVHPTSRVSKALMVGPLVPFTDDFRSQLEASRLRTLEDRQRSSRHGASEPVDASAASQRERSDCGAAPELPGLGASVR